MKITWLGQAGLLFETGSHRILIDPYLSNSVEKINPANWRRFPVRDEFRTLCPTILVCTHNHLDHLDPETLSPIFKTHPPQLAFGPTGSWEKLRSYGGDCNFILFNKGIEWTEREVKLEALPAFHSDPYAIGLLLSAEGKTYYITGDTLYSKELQSAIQGRKPEAVFLPINGKGNNMNPYDAERLARDCAAKYVVPIHFGLFDDLKGDELKMENLYIPTPFEEIELI